MKKSAMVVMAAILLVVFLMTSVSYVGGDQVKRGRKPKLPETSVTNTVDQESDDSILARRHKKLDVELGDDLQARLKKHTSVIPPVKYDVTEELSAKRHKKLDSAVDSEDLQAKRHKKSSFENA